MIESTRLGLSATWAGVALDRVLPALQRLEPHARACWLYDLDAVAERARRFRAAFAGLEPLAAYAIKANSLPAILDVLREERIGAEAGSLGELTMAAGARFEAKHRVLNGNGRTAEEASWVARHGVHSVNADHVGELDLLQGEAAAANTTIRVTLRVNPGIVTPGHRYVSTGDAAAKFGVAPEEALAAWAARARWPHLALDGVHVHVGSQLLDRVPLERALDAALELAQESARRGSPLGLVNLGGGFGVDYSEAAEEFPLEEHARVVVERARPLGFEWVFEPGRWLTARAGILLTQVLWVKPRSDRRFVVLAAGMNDLLRPALYRARHRIVAVHPREGPIEPAVVVGPVCESGDVFADDAMLPPIEAGDLVAILDAGAYGAAMSSNYNGRGRLAELIVEGGRLLRARAGEEPDDLASRTRHDPLETI